MEEAVGDLGDWLVEHGKRWERDEADWLLALVAFDRSQLWALDGQPSCVRWVMWKMHMGRSTVFEKLRVGYAVEQRPWLLEAFRGGRISYTELRLITSLQNATEEVDRALIDVASADGATVGDVERMVRLYLKHDDQDKPPPDPDKRRRVSVRRSIGDGMGEITAVLSEFEIEEFSKVLNSFDDPLFRQACSRAKRGVPLNESAAADSGEESSATQGEGSEGPEASTNEPESDRAARRADAFMNLLAAAMTGDGSRAAGDDRYMLHVVRVIGSAGATTIDGEPLSKHEADMVDCDCSRVDHLITEDGEPLRLGRKTRDWSTAQRRAVNVRDGGRCRFPGCPSRYVDIHHIKWWERKGPTDVDNGASMCRLHHGMIHRKGFQVEGDPNGRLRFSRKDGTAIGSSLPALVTRMRLPEVA